MAKLRQECQEGMLIRILHLSQLPEHNVADLVSGVADQRVHGLVASGFIQGNHYADTVKSFQTMNELADVLRLDKTKILCLPEPQDLAVNELHFSMTLHQPVLNRPFNPTNLELINLPALQILAIPDLMAPGYSGINQAMFDLKVRAGDRKHRDGFRVFFSGLPLDKWHQRPVLFDPTANHILRPIFLHGGGGSLDRKEDHVSVGADKDHFNVVEFEKGQLVIRQFKRNASSFVQSQSMEFETKEVASQQGAGK